MDSYNESLLMEKLHFLVLPAWLLSLVHGVLIGTDTENKLVIMFYVVSGMTMLVLVARTVSQLMKRVNISTSQQ